MKTIDILKICETALKICQETGIRLKDVNYIRLYDDFEKMKMGGRLKVSYIVAVLAEKYGLSERNVYYIKNRLDRDCKISAV